MPPLEELGPYRVDERLGTNVYAATGPDGARVVLRVVSRDLTGRRAAAIEVAKSVGPFCVARVLDADLRSNPPYVVSEHVSGSPLRHVLDRIGPLSPDDVERLAIGTAAALAAIHQAGIAHGDLTPSKVLIEPGVVHVVDLGITGDGAKASDIAAWGRLVTDAAGGELDDGPLKDLVDRGQRDEPLTARDLLVELIGEVPAPVSAAMPDAQAVPPSVPPPDAKGNPGNAEKPSWGPAAIAIGVIGLLVLALTLPTPMAGSRPSDDRAVSEPSPPSPPPAHRITDLTAFGDTIVAVGVDQLDPLFLVSEDGGKSWASGAVSGSVDGPVPWSVAGGKDGWFATTGGMQYWSSEDGRKWRLRDDSAFTAGLRFIENTSDGYVAAGGIQVYTSEKGLDWAIAEMFDVGDEIEQMAVHGDRILVTSRQGGVRSVDGGDTWEPAHLPGRGERAIAADGNGFYVIYLDGREAVAERSDDGKSWRRTGTFPADRGLLRSLEATAGSLYAAVGEDADRNVLWRSRDGAEWERIDHIPSGNVSLAPASEGVIAAGAEDPAKPPPRGIEMVHVPHGGDTPVAVDLDLSKED